MASSESLYERFYNVDDDEKENTEERALYTRYHDTFFTVDEAYCMLKDAIKFNAYDLEEEARLNDIRKRIFYFQRQSQDTLYALRDVSVENDEVIKDVEK